MRARETRYESNKPRSIATSELSTSMNEVVGVLEESGVFIEGDEDGEDEGNSAGGGDGEAEIIRGARVVDKV